MSEPAYLPPSNGGYVTRAEMLAHLAPMQKALERIEGKVDTLTARDAEEHWLGPRGKAAAKWLGRVATGAVLAGIGWVISHFTSG